MRIGGKAPKGGPILQQRHQGHGRKRDTATSDRHRQSRARERERAEPLFFLPARFSQIVACRRTPCGTWPVVTSSHSAISNLRASATIMVFFVVPRPSCVRCRNHWTRALSG